MKLVIHNGSRVWGGNEKWLTGVAIGLREQGHDVVVSCRAGGPVWERLEREGVRVSPVRPGGDVDLVSRLRFAYWLRRERPDTLLLTSWNRTPASVWAARRAGVPRIVVRLGIVRPLPPRGRYTRTFRSGVDALIVNSTEIRDEWLRSAPWFPAEAVHVVLNGIRIPDISGNADDDLRRELGVGSGVRLVAGAGHVTRRKGFDLLLRALARVETPQTHLVIVGSGPEEPELRRLADALAVAPRVHWLGFREQVVQLLAQCDVFVLSSRNEGMANVMLEAMAAGVPVVATEISGVRDALGAASGRSPAGWIVRAEDPNALASALDEVLGAVDAAPELVRRRVDEARERIRTWFSMDRMVDDVGRILFPAHPG